MTRIAAAMLLLASGAALACDGLEVQAGWIRAAPPGAMMTAGYARLANRSGKPITITRVSSRQFADSDLHRTTVEDGMSGMRPALPLTLAPGAVQGLEPGGYHLMLMQPLRELHAGDTATIRFECGTRPLDAPFTVKGDAP